MRVALSAKLRERSLDVVGTLAWQGTKTKELSSRINGLAWNRKTLFVSGGPVPELLERCSRNIQGIRCLPVDQLNIYDAILAKRLVLDVTAIEFLESRYGKIGSSKSSAIPPAIGT